MIVLGKIGFAFITIDDVVQLIVTKICMEGLWDCGRMLKRYTSQIIMWVFVAYKDDIVILSNMDMLWCEKYCTVVITKLGY